MDPRPYSVVLAIFASHVLAISGAIQHQRVARDDSVASAGGGAILDMAKEMTNPVVAVEKMKDAIPVMESVLGGDDVNILGLGRKRRDVSALVKTEDDVDELDSEEVNWRVAHVPSDAAKPGAETTGVSTHSGARLVSEDGERKRRAAGMPNMPSPPSMGDGMNPAEQGQQFSDMAKEKMEASGIPPPPDAPSFPGSERKRRAAGIPNMPSPPSMGDGMNPAEQGQQFSDMAKEKMEASGMPPPPDAPSFPGTERKRRAAQIPQPPSVPDGMTPTSPTSTGMTQPDSMNPAQQGQTHVERTKSVAEGCDVSPPASVRRDGRGRRQSKEDTSDDETGGKHGRGKHHGRGKGKHGGKGKWSSTTPDYS